jgi:hypothetical protein
MHSIVEYATREQAQQAINTLSNQNLMGRLIYVREVGSPVPSRPWSATGRRLVGVSLTSSQDREHEPRFSAPGGRGGYGGGGFGGGAGGYGAGGGGRQIYVSNVCPLPWRGVTSLVCR